MTALMTTPLPGHGDSESSQDASSRAAPESGTPDARLRRLQATHRKAAHDLRSPLNAISLHLDLLRQDLGEGARGAEARHQSGARIALLQREVTRLSRMLHALLEESAPPSSGSHGIDLQPLAVAGAAKEDACWTS
jgi:signal transduction histidine kinase